MTHPRPLLLRALPAALLTACLAALPTSAAHADDTP